MVAGGGGGGKQPNRNLPVHGGIHDNPDTAHHPWTRHTDRLRGNTNLPEHTLTKDPQRSAKREMGAIRNEQQI